MTDEPTESLPQDPNVTTPIAPPYGSYYTPSYGEPHQGQPGYDPRGYSGYSGGGEVPVNNGQQFYGDPGSGYPNPTTRYPSVTDYYGDGTPRSQPQYSEPQYDQFGRPIYFQGQTPPPAPPQRDGRARLFRLGSGLAVLAVVGVGLYLLGEHHTDQQAAQQLAAQRSSAAAAASNGGGQNSAGGGLGGLIPSIPSFSIPSSILGTPGQLPADLPAPGFGKAGDITTRSLAGFTVTTVGYTGVTRAQVDTYVAALNAAGWTNNAAVTINGFNTLNNSAGSETLVLALIGSTLNLTVQTS